MGHTPAATVIPADAQIWFDTPNGGYPSHAPVSLLSSQIAAPQAAAAPQALSGAGAITLTEYKTDWTTGAADAGTLADGSFVGQRKLIQLIIFVGNGTLTPTTLVGGTTITFGTAGDCALLEWTTSGWVAIDLFNRADGATAPALA